MVEGPLNHWRRLRIMRSRINKSQTNELRRLDTGNLVFIAKCHTVDWILEIWFYC